MKHSIESAYCFFHQKWRVYQYSNSPQQKEEIEYAIASYVETMNSELYKQLAQGRTDFLLSHSTFSSDIANAVNQLEAML
ncbi:MAG: hypothetical protein IJ911_11885 [Salinivirgaceae bacterium]|nr:hypothetical protein [Salinivirgaceae bacterium]